MFVILGVPDRSGNSTLFTLTSVSAPVICAILLASDNNPAAAALPPAKGPKNANVAPTMTDAPSL